VQLNLLKIEKKLNLMGTFMKKLMLIALISLGSIEATIRSIACEAASAYLAASALYDSYKEWPSIQEKPMKAQIRYSLKIGFSGILIGVALGKICSSGGNKVNRTII
jgi:hypothetical protein